MTKSICFYTTSDLSGHSGNNIATKEIVKAFAKNDELDITLIAPKPRSANNASVFAMVNKVYYLPKKSGNKYWWHIKIQPRILHLMSKIKKVDSIICRVDPSQILFPLITKVKKVDHILLIRGLTPMGVRSSTIVSYILNFVTYRNAESANKVIVAYEDVLEQMQSSGWNSSKKVTVFPNAVDVNLFHHTPIDQAREEINLPFGNDEFVIGFVGSIQKKHQVKPLINAVSECKKEGIEIKVLIVGNGPQKSELESLCKKKNIQSNVVFTGQVPHNSIDTYISACNSLYGVVDPNYPTNPIKCYEYLACERPIITTFTPEFSFVSDTESGTIITEITQESIKNAILDLYSMSPFERRLMGKRGRSYICENHTWDKLVTHCVEN